MNTSRKTTIIAKGIALYAAVQDQTPADQSEGANAIRNAWAVWCDAYPQWAEVAQAEQYNLFHRVNNLED